MTALGAVFRPQLPPERLRAMVRTAEDAGLEELWLWEDCFLEGGISAAAAALAWSERLRVGVGLLPVPLRNVAVTAMETATLHRLFPGRAIVGVGHGVQDWMGQVGARAESPVTLLREYLVALRALLRGERVTTDGRYVKLDDVALDWPPQTPVEILAGATGPRTLRLSGEFADGTILTSSTSPEGVRKARQLIDEGWKSGSRDGTHEVVVYLLTATGPDAADRLRAELEADGVATVPDLGVAGNAEAVAKAVQRLADAGADTVILQPTADEPDPEGFVRFTAEDVRPLVP
ncbi:alkanesulfonate monooxygenase SsuD/methylene tetrahydromethanopterin reductase-like flavin-dependent oxidoreductase (luciferase family) [Streptomyces umbrinus]|uniref:LLM class flavin-dependent oxidoreductase n=1 Tax=Streptomyces TaxID=1883 RepID=UPI00167D654B|nr:LLM class flavin-dependent oxidoreductase [Streptomyces umbrinus]MCR3725900.1 alkanesulfonate monooxygenase SsuD/methylene tetrahydromethanopterin reductase-like flavin-dependent oxidoreductase (luciferase family) [Streptomyces umbrinus]MCX4560593.1 LLM class flavin-dependent oxidoreductase [Streptomyces phaeochromogenes]GHH49665.1 oxidoreductase [Streptomyces umbrinus]